MRQLYTCTHTSPLGSNWAVFLYQGFVYIRIIILYINVSLLLTEYSCREKYSISKTRARQQVLFFSPHLWWRLNWIKDFLHKLKGYLNKGRYAHIITVLRGWLSWVCRKNCRVYSQTKWQKQGWCHIWR